MPFKLVALRITLLQQSMSYLLVVLIMASQFSCNPSSSVPEQKPYFDLTGFFDKEVQRLTEPRLWVDGAIARMDY